MSENKHIGINNNYTIDIFWNTIEVFWNTHGKGVDISIIYDITININISIKIFDSTP